MKSNKRESEDDRTYRLLQKYARAYRKGRIPEQYTKDSAVTYTQRVGFRSYDIPLPRGLKLAEALAAAELQ